MATDKPRNMSASIRQRLLNHSAAIKTDPNLVLIWYGLERFLYRLSVSTHSDRFVLKGAMLFRLWGGADFRSTKDLDLEGFLQDEAGVVREVFASICAQPVEDDGLIFDATSVRVTEIRETQEYGGFRILLTARLEPPSCVYRLMWDSAMQLHRRQPSLIFHLFSASRALASAFIRERLLSLRSSRLWCNSA